MGLRLIPKISRFRKQELHSYTKADRETLVSLCVAMLPILEQHPQILEYLKEGQDVEVHVCIGDARHCQNWRVDADAEGFFAVACRKGREFEIAEHLEVYINLDMALKALQPTTGCKFSFWDQMSESERLGELQAWLMTIPHEILHALEWHKQTGGLTPLQVFDQGDGEIGLLRVQRAIEARIQNEHGQGQEDRVESLAYSIMSTSMPDLAYEVISRSHLGEKTGHTRPMLR
jgi:hypothetical protein